MDPRDFLNQVISPTLGYLGLSQPAAQVLLLGTALKESGGLRYLVQRGGPALGFYQIEPATALDVIVNYLPRDAVLASKVRGLQAPGHTIEQGLVMDLGYATAMARLIYWRRPTPLPVVNDAYGMWTVYKADYNSVLGAATEADTLPWFQQAVTLYQENVTNALPS